MIPGVRPLVPDDSAALSGHSRLLLWLTALADILPHANDNWQHFGLVLSSYRAEIETLMMRVSRAAMQSGFGQTLDIVGGCG